MKIRREPKIGDYVAVKHPKMLVYLSHDASKEADKIYIAKILDIKNNIYRTDYGKKYPNNQEVWWLQRMEIIDFSKKKKKLKYLKGCANYNL